MGAFDFSWSKDNRLLLRLEKTCPPAVAAAENMSSSAQHCCCQVVQIILRGGRIGLVLWCEIPICQTLNMAHSEFCNSIRLQSEKGFWCQCNRIFDEIYMLFSKTTVSREQKVINRLIPHNFMQQFSRFLCFMINCNDRAFCCCRLFVLFLVLLQVKGKSHVGLR